MLHIVLFVLKILGILAAVVLGSVLACALLVLFVPVRYRADGSYHKSPRGEACISWLFRAFRVTASWEEALVVTGKILWIQVFRETLWEETPEREEEGNEDPWAGLDGCFPVCEPEDEPPAAGEAVDQEPEMIHMAELAEPEERGFDRSREPDVKKEEREEDSTPLERMEEAAGRIRGRLRSAKTRYRSFRQVLTDEENQRTLRLVRRQAVRLIRHLLPQTLTGTLRFGFEDPSHTGQALAAVSPFYGAYAKNFTLIPDFEERILEGEVHIRGRIRAAAVLWTAGRVFLNKNFRRLLRGKGRRKE